jgi:hypothetical protein
MPSCLSSADKADGEALQSNKVSLLARLIVLFSQLELPMRTRATLQTSCNATQESPFAMRQGQNVLGS